MHPIYKQRRFHQGIDLRAPVGTAVYTAQTGRVSSAAWNGGYGKLVVIEHDNGFSTRYAHLSRFCVSGGEHVRQGQKIALSGNTGLSTGPHLHFEIRQAGGNSIDPARFIMIR